MTRLAILVVGFLAAAWPAWAGDLALIVTNGSGKPVTDAVVTVYPAGAPRGGPIRFPWPNRVVQRNLQFEPFVLIAPVGSEVAFPNQDQVRHHVYSFSPAHPFEIKLYGKDETRVVRFEKAGAIALGCNIHDQMLAFIKVVDTPFAAKSDAAGRMSVRGMPGGSAIMRVWHPYLKAPGNEISRNVELPAAGTLNQAVKLDIRAPLRRRGAY
jgi:hypothetical protein